MQRQSNRQNNGNKYLPRNRRANDNQDNVNPGVSATIEQGQLPNLHHINQNNQGRQRNQGFNIQNNQKQQRRNDNQNNQPQYRRNKNGNQHNEQQQKQEEGAYSQNQGQKKRDRTNNNSRNQNQFRETNFSFTYLTDLNKKSSDEVITALAKRKDEFEKFLNDDVKPDLLVLTLRVLSNICQANFTEMVTSILSNACSTKFIKGLHRFLQNLPFETIAEKFRNKLYHEDKNKFWSDLDRFFKKLIDLIPTKARDELTDILEKLNQIIPFIENSQNFIIEESVKNSLMNMSEDLKKEIEKIKKNKKDSQACTSVKVIEEDPPEDFRLLSVIPTMHDLLDPKPFIRPCKVENAYDSVEHYLDVQFRLLREDFISPLRSGLQQYLEGSQHTRNNDVRVYKKVSFVAPNVTKKDVSIELNFGIVKGINWKFSKRLMFGGLLLLSKDNFKTIQFFTITDRDERELKKGCIFVVPCPGSNMTREMYGVNFVMIESKIYFEPYLAVLTAMQQMNINNFPMEPYLVHGDMSIRNPKYLNKNDNTSRGLLKYKNIWLPAAYDAPWPTAHELNLDESQYQAFKAALTQDFAVIQGPPGTGKTFIALEIVRALLTNKNYWIKYGPIVIVCLTNHALDQFLEGILEHTQSIVRVGSRSKSEKMKPYTLMERRQTVKKSGRSEAISVMYAIKHELECVLNSLKRARVCLQLLETKNAIVPLACLMEFVNVINENAEMFNSNTEFVKWLLGDKVCEYMNSKKPKIIVEGAEELNYESFNLDEDRYMDNDLEFECDFKQDDDYNPILPLESIDAKIEEIRKNIDAFRLMAVDNLVDNRTAEVQKYDKIYKTLMEQKLYLELNLAQHPIYNKQHKPVKDPRWKMYWAWIHTSYQMALDELSKLDLEYRQLNLKLNEAQQIADLKVLKMHDIIGLTTTGAAKLHATLRALRAPIVLVEEAAEILEAHVVCAMTQHCQHAILIGDHKQLRPKASVYQLGTKYNLNISLFERMVKIRGDYTQLQHQHRMRPEFAKLLTPSIYEKLFNHESVLKRPNIKGLVKNLYFIHHEHSETSGNNEDSWVNEHECEFLVAFARYLIRQGYEPSEVTILCTYSGQLFALMKETQRYAILKEMRVTTVDNFQGEENKIILLSLVRNNNDGNIGFLKEENRVCVALSRARDGMYIMGNMNDLIKQNNIWPKIKKVLEDEKAIGNVLELRCQIHPTQITLIKDVADFQQCPEGGCLKQCNLNLHCGHTCASVCHILDREHVEYLCKRPCFNTCDYEHPCPLRCYEVCQPCKVLVKRRLKCGHTMEMLCSNDPEIFKCTFKIETVLPDCNHIIMKPCYLSIKDAKCTHPCEENRLPCGHVCQQKCHVNKDPEHLEYKCFRECAKSYANCEENHKCQKLCYEECIPCPIKVEKTRSCGHHYKQFVCSANVEDLECQKPCLRPRSCGHKCRSKCCEPCQDCQEEVKKRSSCNHIIKLKCCEEATPLKCKGKCPKLLPCGHPCTNRCKDICTVNCETKVTLNKPGLCKHNLKIPCYLRMTDPTSIDLLQYCTVPCNSILNCEHACNGTCGTCKQGRLHVSCSMPCNKILICGHECTVPCRLECQPCKKKCELKCRHSKCSEKCGTPCTPCNEKCDWGCEHRQCSKKCSELCDIEPCNEPCKKKLKCDHPCVGFCGDPCPPLCRICDNDELTELFFGDEDDENARFIYLEDCKHCIESNGLTKWVTEFSESVQMKECPKCKTPIRKCLRLMNQIKNDLRHVMLVKKKHFSNNDKDLHTKQMEYVETLSMILNNPNILDFPKLKNYVNSMYNKGIPIQKQRKQILNAQEIESFRVILDILGRLLKSFSTAINRHAFIYKYILKQINMLVEALPENWQITGQRVNDIELELQRLNYMVELCKNKYFILLPNKKFCDTVQTKLLSIEKFTEKLEEEIRQEINFLLQSCSTEQLKIEREMIVKAMGYRQGHWFKCPNGHIYMIGECGGAMQRSKCNECKADIGGSSHRLLSDNSLASEMDGATRPAYSDFNYHDYI